jgi:hypothetical protein
MAGWPEANKDTGEAMRYDLLDLYVVINNHI